MGITSEEKARVVKQSHMKAVLFIFSICIITQSMVVTGALNVSISTIEKLYRYNSFHVSFIDVFYNVGFALSAFALGYIVEKNKLRWIGLGMLTISIGCLVYIFPVVLIELRNDTIGSTSLLCTDSPREEEKCENDKNHLYLIIMCVGYFLIGIGAAPLHTLAVTFLQENTSPKQAGLFSGIYYTCSALGPAYVFICFSYAIKIPLKLYQEDGDISTYKDENWVGAYWIVYFIGSAVSFVISIPLFLFPTPDGVSFENSENNKACFGGSRFWYLTKELVSNRPFMLMTLGLFFEAMLRNSVSVFMAKYVEAQFQISQDKAALYSGMMIVSGAAIGLLSGGLMIKIFELNIRKLIRNISMISFISAISLLFLFFRCPENPIKGLYDDVNILKFKDKDLSSQCHCEISEYYPVCVGQNKSYYSPCSIGCKSKLVDGDGIKFDNCSENHVEHEEVVSHGRCSLGCKFIYAFLALGCVAMFIKFMNYVPSITFTVQVLDEETRLYGLSIQQILLRVAFMIGPIYQGKLFDLSCRHFKPSFKCNSKGNCVDYDLKKLSYSIAMPTLIQGIISTMFLFMAFCFVENY